MDAHPVSFTSISQRSTSRIWKDLKTCRPQTTIELGSDDDMSDTTGRLLTQLGKRRGLVFTRKPHVGIIGAGLAGLRCADILLHKAFQVTILEGRNRLGGRVHQEALPSGRIVDAGPNWIHGTSDNPILDLAKQTNTAVGTWDTKTSVLDDAGTLFGHKDAEKYSTMMWDVIEAAFRHSNQNCASIDKNESLWDFFQDEVAKRIPESEEGFETKRNTVFQMSESWGAFVGNHIFSQSLKYFWLEECIEGENLFCSGTYKDILQRIAEPAISDATIKYQTVVNHIRSTDDESGALQVTTRDGQILEFDEVVVTAPLGWLKRNQDSFAPPLPKRMSQAIGSIGYGCLEKVYISFPTAFWLKPDAKEEAGVSGFCQWLAPQYAPDSNPRRWAQEMVELADLTPETSHPTLLFYTYGEQSKYITEKLANFEAVAATEATEKHGGGRAMSPQAQDFLYAWFRPYYSRLPGYDAEICRPTGCYATRWLGDELAGHGSYSNFQVGLESGDEDIETMREGLPDRGLWLAGEHTAPFVALGTATGAYWSGESVGKRIAGCYGRGE